MESVQRRYPERKENKLTVWNQLEVAKQGRKEKIKLQIYIYTILTYLAIPRHFEILCLLY